MIPLDNIHSVSQQNEGSLVHLAGALSTAKVNKTSILDMGECQVWRDWSVEMLTDTSLIPTDLCFLCISNSLCLIPAMGCPSRLSS